MMTLNHGFSGYVCGRVLMPLLRRRAPLSEKALGWAFFLGAMMPDLDIAGKWLGGPGVFFSGAWYGHRGASHSVVGTLVLAVLCAAILYRPLTAGARGTLRAGRPGEGPAGAQGAGEVAGPRSRFWPGLHAYGWAVGAFWLGGLLHLFGDIFTPARALQPFWPLPFRFGALSHIGWFSPYLLWLFLATIALGWGLLAIAGRGPAQRPGWLAAVWLLHAGAAYRWVDFALGSRYESGWQWNRFQRELLPEAMVTPFSNGVATLWYWFTG